MSFAKDCVLKLLSAELVRFHSNIAHTRIRSIHHLDFKYILWKGFYRMVLLTGTSVSRVKFHCSVNQDPWQIPVTWH